MDTSIEGIVFYAFGKISKNCGISKKDKVMEIGFGRGRCCFWLSSFVGCEVLGVEQIPFFSSVAIFISKVFKIKNLKLFCLDMLDVSYEDIDFVYLYGTCMKDKEIYAFLDKCKSMKKNSKVIIIG